MRVDLANGLPPDVPKIDVQWRKADEPVGYFMTLALGADRVVPCTTMGPFEMAFSWVPFRCRLARRYTPAWWSRLYPVGGRVLLPALVNC